MNFMRVQLNTTAFTLFLATAILFSSCAGENKEGEVKNDNPVSVTVAVAGAQANNTIQASGQIDSKETAVISTRVMGFITSIRVKTGDKVQKGQLLATISNADIQAKRAQAQAMVAEAEAAMKDAQKDYERFAELYKQNSASAKEFENATLHYNSVKAKEETAKQMLNETEAMLTYTNLIAPFAGVITQKNIDAGSMANPGVPILMMEQAGSYQVSASVSEGDIANVKEGADATVLIKSTGRVMNGKISAVSPSSQFSGGQYGIKVHIPEKEKNGLYSGMYVNVTIQTSEKTTANNNVLVPISAILYKDQLTGLYTLTENNTALLRWVKLGKVQGDQVEILSGLRNDEKFILTSEGKLYNGIPVSPK
jgi:RND family efflux transporter MFP subunit